MSNTFTKFIDSCVGAIARKVQDEFDESKHPRDKGGKFTSKGNEGRGGGADDDEFVRQWARKEALEKGRDLSEVDKKFFTNEPKSKVPKRKYDSDEEELVSVSLNRGDSESAIVRALEALGYDESSAQELIGRVKSSSSIAAKKEIGSGKESGSEGDDDEGYMGLSKEELAEEEEYENARERARREKDDDRVTGPEDRDYMNEEDDDDPYEQDYEEGTSTTNLYGDKKQAPAVINALQHQYDGDAKKVGYIVRHLNSVTTNPEIWGEYTVKEIIDDIEDRYGKLDSMAKRHIDTYLRKTKPSEWDSETEYWKQKNKNFPGPKELAFYE